MRRTIILGISLCLFSSSASAADFYVDPVKGSPAGDGSAELPWRTIQEVFDSGLVESRQWDRLPLTEQSTLVASNVGAPIRAGDTIWLRSGYHGAADVLEEHNFKIHEPARLFVDPEHFDLRLLPGTPAIDAGGSRDAPKLDHDRVARPQGDGVDLSALEWRPDEVVPAEPQQENNGKFFAGK